MVTTIRSAYKKATFGMKYFEDKDTFQKIKQKLKSGIPEEDIKKQLNVRGDVVEDVKKEIKTGEDIFWSKNDKGTVTIEPLKYSEFLVKNGFNKYYPENAEKPTFVRVIENKVRISSTEQIKDFVLTYLQDKGELDVWNHCSKLTILFNESFLNMIDSINILMLQDTKDASYIPYKNGVAKVTKDAVDLMS